MRKENNDDLENKNLEMEVSEEENLCCENVGDNKRLGEIADRQAMEEFLINVLQFAIEAVKAYNQSNNVAYNLQDKQSAEGDNGQKCKVEEEVNEVSNKPINVWVYNNNVVDFLNFVATVDGEIVNLGAVPIRILKILLEHKGKTLTRGQILNQLWGTNKELYDRTIDSHISMLKRTLGLKNYIRSVRGIGYRID